MKKNNNSNLPFLLLFMFLNHNSKKRRLFIYANLQASVMKQETDYILVSIRVYMQNKLKQALSFSIISFSYLHKSDDQIYHASNTYIKSHQESETETSSHTDKNRENGVEIKPNMHLLNLEKANFSIFLASSTHNYSEFDIIISSSFTKTRSYTQFCSKSTLTGTQKRKPES